MIQLEEFFIKFGVDAKPLLEAVDKINATTDKTKVKLEEMNPALNKVAGGFQNLARYAIGAATAFISFNSVVSGVKGAYSYALQLGQASRALNVNVESLDAWGRAVERNGGSAQSLQSSIAGLAGHLNIRNQDALNLLPKLADTFARVKGQRAIMFGQRLGLDQSTVLFLQQGRREVEAMIARQKELGVVTKQDTEIAMKFNGAWHDTGYAFRSMWLTVASTVLPIIQTIAESFTEMAIYFRKHSEFIKGALLGIGIAAGIAALPFIVMNAGVLLVSAAIAGLIGLFAVVYEDIKVFKAGGESAIGYFLQKWPILNTLFLTTKAILDGIAGTWQLITTGDLSGLKQATSGFLEAYNTISGKNTESATETNSIFNNLGSSAISNQTSNSLANSYRSSNSSFQTGNITINAPEREGGAIASALNREVFDKYNIKNATNSFADGQLI